MPTGTTHVCSILKFTQAWLNQINYLKGSGPWSLAIGGLLVIGAWADAREMRQINAVLFIWHHRTPQFGGDAYDDERSAAEWYPKQKHKEEDEPHL